MKWLPNSIRWRIQLWHGLFLLLVLTAFGLTAYRLQRQNELAQVDAALRLQLRVLHEQLTQGQAGRPGGDRRPPGDEDEALAQLLLGVPSMDAERPPPGPRMSDRPDVAAAFAGGSYFHVWMRDGGTLDRSPNAPDSALPPQAATTQFRDRAGFREAYEFTPPGECLLVGVSDAAINAAMTRFTWEIIGYGGVVLLLGLLGGWWMASRAIAPIRDISEAAQRIAGGQLKERIPVAETESELGQLAGVLNDTFAQLHTAFEQQSRFTSDAAHELRTPVSIILAQTQLALSRPRTPEANLKTIEMARRSAERMRGLIESLLTLAKADAEAGRNHDPVQLDAVSRENLDNVRPMAEEKQIILQDDLPPTTCRADAGHVSQILTNLLTNAVNYCRPGDAVRVSTHRQNGHAILTVADTGPGIPAEHLPHLFERFYRADASRNRNTGGAGLGLAICKALAEAQGGSITVKSSLEKGTTFEVTLPAAKS